MIGRYKKYKPPYLKRNQAGEKICVMCGKPLTGRQRKWCGSKDCLFKQFIRSGDHTAMREFLLDRDKGICAECGLDLNTIAMIGKYVRGHAKIQKPQHILNRDWGRACKLDYHWSYKEWMEFLKILDVDPGGYSHYWEADHIVAVKDGGIHHEDNLQTLCLNCHHKKTRNKS